ncbi:MAG: isochorismate synthase [Chlamydiota bacterium]
MIGSILYKAQAQESAWIDLPEYLAGQDLFPKFYHKCKDTQEERAAFGSLVTLPFIPKITKKIDPSLCFYGALSFPSHNLDTLWNDFPSTLFFLPLYEIRQTPKKTTLYVRSLPSSKPLKPSIWLEDAWLLEERIDTPTKEDWHASVKALLQVIENKKLQKVVLARKTSFSIDPSLHPFCFLKKLLKEAPSTTTFALQTTPNSLFLGSSPEKLYKREDDILHTEAIAGTRKRSLDPLEDEALKVALQKSIKDKKEVLHVKTFLEKELSSLCKEVSSPKKASLIQTEKLHHLHYAFKGLLHEEVTDIDLLKALHPTPAVNGTPKDLALAAIRQIETYNRGLYAGPIGWISSLEASFTVAIRSSLIKEGSLHAFAGTGIVQGSEPHLEWEELDHKISHWKSPCLI